MNPLVKFISCLDSHGIRHTSAGGEVRFPCPAHGGTRDSGAACLSDDGKLLLTCHSQHCQAADICRAVGMEPREMFPESNGHANSGNGHGKVNGKKVHDTWESVVMAMAWGLTQSEKLPEQRKPDLGWMYHNADGTEAGIVVRWNTPAGKEIRQARRTQSGWVCEAMPSPRPLFNLLAVNEAAEVWICEGEKAASALVEQLELVATTPSQGAQSPQLTDWSVLAGKRVIILPDNDTAGDIFAGRVAGLIAQHAPDATVEIKLLKDLWPEIPEKGDAYDWLLEFEFADKSILREKLDGLPDRISDYEIDSSHLNSDGNASGDYRCDAFIEGERVRCGDRDNIGTVEHDDGGPTVLVHFVARDGTTATKPIARDQVKSLDNPSKGGRVIVPRIPLNVAELIEKYPNLKPAVIDGLIREAETCGLHSKTKIGKSWLAYGVALSVSSGTPWLGCFPCSQGRVLLIDNELHKENLANRLPRVARAMGLADSEWKTHLDVLSLRGDLLDIEELSTSIEAEPGKYRLIICDALYRLLPSGVPENDNAAVTQVMNTVDRYAQKTGAAFLFVHHASKGDQSGKDVTDVGSGAGSLSRAVDTHIAIRPHKEDGCVVLETAVRSWEPVEPLVLRWEFPIWRVAEELDPGALRRPKSLGDAKQEQRDKEGREEVIRAIRQHGPSTRNMLVKNAGMGKERLNRVISQLVKSGELKSSVDVSSGNQTERFHLSECGS